MGSGLILLVIVCAWLAVLVPMALRSHDTAASSKAPERFSDAMRALSLKGSRDVLVPRRAPSLVVSETRSPRPAPVRSVDAEELRMPRVPATAAQRRRRSLLMLLALSVGTLLGGLLGPALLLRISVVSDLLLVGFIVHLRRQAVLRAELARRRARAGVAARRPVVLVAGIPERMPVRPAPLSVPLPAPAARHEDPLPATGTDGSWSPVPVPLPTYVGKATAPPRAPRVLDLTRPGAWSEDALATGSAELSELLEDADGTELDDILERRRVPGGW